MDGKALGKIRAVTYGLSEGCMGLFFTLGDGTWGVQDSITFVSPLAERTELTKWAQEERGIATFEVHKRIAKLMKDAGVEDVMKLKDKPIEATFDGNVLRSWRILTEVL